MRETDNAQRVQVRAKEWNHANKSACGGVGALHLIYRSNIFGHYIIPSIYIQTAVKAAPTPLPSNTVLRTNSESKPRCPEQPEAYTFTLII